MFPSYDFYLQFCLFSLSETYSDAGEGKPGKERKRTKKELKRMERSSTPGSWRAGPRLRSRWSVRSKLQNRKQSLSSFPPPPLSLEQLVDIMNQLSSL